MTTPTETNKQVIITKFGEPAKVLRTRVAPIPYPDRNQVLVRLVLRPINPSDVNALDGGYAGFRPKSFPAVPGFEGVGIVSHVGPGVSRVTKGQRVVTLVQGAVGNGSWQEYVVVGEEDVVPVPDGVADTSAAQALVNPLSVLGMLDGLAPRKGDWILQDAAGSALGRMLITVAKDRGIKTVNIVRRKQQVQELLDLGADAVIATEGLDTAERVVKAILQATGGKRPHGAISAVGGNSTTVLTLAVQRGGTVFVYGALGGVTAEVHGPSLIFRDITVRGYWLTFELAKMSPSVRNAKIARVLDLMRQGIIHADHVGEIYELDDVVAALAKSVEPSRGGKVFLGSKTGHHAKL
ncbi:hypothetical protein BC830DRAFT_1106846 [Chytriomyces sp. MP71]|nr:hypothetical protein BC830DRAFT_1106846 [Chytriomyces sp. MP71]